MFDIDNILKELETKDTETAESPENILPTVPEDDSYTKSDYSKEPVYPCKKHRKVLLPAIIGGVLVVLLVVSALWVNSHFVVAGGLHPRDSQALDLREKNISMKQYEKLTTELPGCDIRWNVPIGSSAYDSHAQTLVISDVEPGVADGFVCFRQLKSLDITSAALSAEDFHAIAAALPDTYIRWSIPIGGSRYDSAASEIAVTDFSAGEVELFGLFDKLETVDATACRCYDEILSLQALLPETKVLWNVELNGELLHQDTTAITVDGGEMDYTALSEYLHRLPALEQVSVDNCTLTAQEQRTLLDTYPSIAFTWPVELLGKVYDSTITELSYADRTDLTAGDLQTIADSLDFFRSLEVLDLSGCDFAAEEILPLYEMKPDLTIFWEFELYGHTFSTKATEMDLSGIAVEDTAPLEAAVARMPYLKKVIMCDCGLSDEVMDGLNQKYEDIRFIWTVQIGPYSLRTDAVGFIGYLVDGRERQLYDEDVVALKYCTDLVALDLGHKYITNLDFVQYMPNLKYLIISRSQVRSFAPLAGLQNLEHLEAWMVSASDVEYLQECPNLKDLHIAFINTTHNNPKVMETLTSITGLERLWACGTVLSAEHVRQLNTLMPECQVYIVDKETHVFFGGWRYHERYYEMRDLLGMFYMNERGIMVRYKIIDGVWIFPEDEAY